MMRYLMVILLGVSTAVLVFAGEGGYVVAARDAPIGDLARMLAQLDGKNVVVPAKIDGAVTANFESTTLMNALRSILDANGYGVIVKDNTVAVATREVLEKMGSDLEVATIPLKYSRSVPVALQAKALISDRGAVIVDERTNALTVRDTEAKLAQIRQLIQNIDKQDRQVLIEAKIIEASDQFSRNIGIQWGVNRTAHSASFGGVTGVGTGQAGNPLNVNTPGGTLSGLSLALGSFKGVVTDVQITAAEENGYLNILSRPSVVTLNNQAAKIHSGIKFYVKSPGNVSIGSGTSGATAATSNLQEITAGITMTVTPQITIDDSVNLVIDVTESQPDFSKPVDGTPSIIDNTATTTVLLGDGETTIIGGLFQTQKSKSRRGVPGLSRIPLFGALFSNTQKQRTKKELMIFIKPTIVRRGGPSELPSYPDSVEKVQLIEREKPQYTPDRHDPQQEHQE